MKSFTIRYTTPEDLVGAQCQLEEVPPNRILIQVFCGEPSIDYLQALVAELKSRFPHTALLGTTSAREREELISDLRVALAEIKTLRGLIPICANCKSVRDDKGYWNAIEEYLAAHTRVQFTHGLCPGCAEELYPEIYEKIKEEEPSGDPFFDS